MKLEWNVFVDDFNGQNIRSHNVFNHYRFMDDLIKIKKKYKDDFDNFSKEVKKSLGYYYWSKSEWEVVVTSFPPYIDYYELARCCNEYHERIDKYGTFVREPVSLEVGEKIDVYRQVLMNWNQFINYLWNNKRLIKHES